MKIINKLTFAALAVALLFLTPITRADDQGHDGHLNQGSATVTWTKWVTWDPPQPPIFGFLAGTVGGDVGGGTFTAGAFGRTLVPDGVDIVADYHFHGSKHSFTARLYIEQRNILNELGLVIGQVGVVKGVITDGWLKDQVVEGAYMRITHQHGGPTDFAFEGILEIKKASKDKD